MAFKTVLTMVTEPTQAGHAVAAAATLALACDGHLDVLALGMDLDLPGYGYIGGEAVVTTWALERAESDARAIEQAARLAIAKQDPALRWTMETAVAHWGGLTDIVAKSAGFADLVVLPLPHGAGEARSSEGVLEAALFAGRALVLLVPDNADFGRLANPRTIVVAWNESVEALNAAKRALPFLCAADKVEVTIINPRAHGPESSDPGGSLCQFLVRHGVKAEVTVLARTLPDAADVLLQHALDQSADLLVMGAYGHSRLREAILGGATRTMLERSKIPVLMAH